MYDLDRPWKKIKSKKWKKILQTPPAWHRDDKAILANSLLNYKNQPCTTEISNFSNKGIEIKYETILGTFETTDQQSIIELKDDPKGIMGKQTFYKDEDLTKDFDVFGSEFEKIKTWSQLNDEKV